MIGYIITSTLLSAIGWLAYIVLVRRQATPFHQKWFIYFVVISSLLLPALGHRPQVPALLSSLLSPPVPEEISKAGFEAELRHFCNCEDPNLSHRIHYRSNTAINFLFDHKHWLSAAVLLGLGLVMLRILGQYFYLFSLKRRSQQETRVVNGRSFQILHPSRPHAIGAFRLDQPYLIWQKEMDQLNAPELSAILEHELSHLRQHNTLEKAVLSLIQCVWLLNPFFYFFRHRLELISEWIADEAGCRAIGSRKAYASLLLNLKERQTLAAASHFKGQGSLQIRICYLLAERSSNWGIPLLTLILVLGLQFTSQPYVSAQVDQTLYNLQTYEVIYQEHPREEEFLYCPDCHSVCLPEIEFNECVLETQKQLLLEGTAAGEK